MDVNHSRLEQAGIQPDKPAIVKERSYATEDWMAEAQGRVLYSEELIGHLERCPEDTG